MVLHPVARIRDLFLEPKPMYDVPEAAELLGMTRKKLRAWIDAGEIEPLETDARLVLPWAELVSFAMDFWDQAEVESALGADLADAIPELLRLAELEVRVPRLEVVALERVAARDGTSLDTVLARELLDFVSAHSDWLSEEVPGFAAALAWPISGSPAR
jgi:hypothetical protein